jgi:hypothetical protein
MSVSELFSHPLFWEACGDVWRLVVRPWVYQRLARSPRRAVRKLKRRKPRTARR